MKIKTVHTFWHHVVGDVIHRGNGDTWTVIAVFDAFTDSGVRHLKMLLVLLNAPASGTSAKSTKLGYRGSTPRRGAQ